jgi:hypothetical protein
LVTTGFTEASKRPAAAPSDDDQICYVAVTALTSVSAKMRPRFERRGMSAFKGVVASTDRFDSTFQAAADTNGVAIGIRRASVHWHVNKSLS